RCSRRLCRSSPASCSRARSRSRRVTTRTARSICRRSRAFSDAAGCGVRGPDRGLRVPGTEVVAGEMDRAERPGKRELQPAAAGARVREAALPPLDLDLLHDAPRLGIEVVEVGEETLGDAGVVELGERACVA